MAPPASSIQFIETSLSCTSPFALSYPDPKQKWLIRKHLLSLIQDYPTFTPSTDTFYHNDGTIVNLLNAKGNLHVSNNSSITPLVPLTIWLHQNYPYMPPIVFVTSTNHMDRAHPFVDPSSGATNSPYLQTWIFPKSNLTKMVQNLVRIFSHIHPFLITSCQPGPSLSTHPSLVSKMEALDRLSVMLHYDATALLAGNEEEIEGLEKLNREMVSRAAATTSIIDGLEQERDKLNACVAELMIQADELKNWLDENDVATEDCEDGFEAVDEESRLMIACLAADRATEDVMYALDKAVEQELVTCEAYIKQVRILAREQFYHRAMHLKDKSL